MRRLTVAFFIRLALFLVPITVGGLLLLTYWSPARTLAIVARGRSGGCSAAQALSGLRLTQRQMEFANRLVGTSRLLQRDEKGLEQWRTERGDWWMEPGGLRPHLAVLAEQETEIYGTGEMGVRPGDVVLDCGAAYGAFTRKALQLGAKLVVAIEPVPRTLECLQRNLAAEIAQDRVIVSRTGVWDREEQLRMSGDSLVLGTKSTESEMVRLTTIDRLVAELGLKRVDFIKMDIEGAETRAISGAAATLRHFRPRMALCVYHKPGDREEIPKLVFAAQPTYRTQILCVTWREQVRPEVAHFY